MLKLSGTIICGDEILVPIRYASESGTYRHAANNGIFTPHGIFLPRCIEHAGLIHQLDGTTSPFPDANIYNHYIPCGLMIKPDGNVYAIADNNDSITVTLVEYGEGSFTPLMDLMGTNTAINAAWIALDKPCLSDLMDAIDPYHLTAKWRHDFKIMRIDELIKLWDKWNVSQ